MSTSLHMAGIIVKPRSRIFHGHDWVYASEIKKTFGNPEPRRFDFFEGF